MVLQRSSEASVQARRRRGRVTDIWFLTGMAIWVVVGFGLNQGRFLVLEVPRDALSLSLSVFATPVAKESAKASSSPLSTVAPTKAIPVNTTLPTDATVAAIQHPSQPRNSKQPVHEFLLPPFVPELVLNASKRLQGFTERPGLGNLSMRNVSLPIVWDTSSSDAQTIPMVYFNKSMKQKKHGLYQFENYAQEGRFEGSVTQTWLAIAASPEDANGGLVVDVGMNTGFYTLLSATLAGSRTNSFGGVIAFDIQKDCFDVASLLLLANGVEEYARLCHAGIWRSSGTTMNVTEGCDPGKGVDDKDELNFGAEIFKGWKRSTHTVQLVTLGDVFSALRTKSTDGSVALLKIDAEGAEVAAIRGIPDDQLRAGLVRNIILECALERMKRLGFSFEDALYDFEQRLVRDGGYSPYMLYHPFKVPRDRWFDGP
mmetsp:Transcript_22071/g.53435  ORF Transcript_22071/g.53435 Transcript_22071/m.53435 type:complete len:428 (-) Transcript_22071:399-1682(-)